MGKIIETLQLIIDKVLLRWNRLRGLWSQIAYTTPTGFMVHLDSQFKVSLQSMRQLKVCKRISVSLNFVIQGYLQHNEASYDNPHPAKMSPLRFLLYVSVSGQDLCILGRGVVLKAKLKIEANLRKEKKEKEKIDEKVKVWKETKRKRI